MTRRDLPARARIAILLAWAFVVTATAIRHEPWRDEACAYTAATSTATVGELFRVLRTDGFGHPALWYLLLRGAHSVVPVPAVLPAVSLLVAAAAVFLFVARSPFGPLVTVLFPFSVLPLYEYSVMARNYGLSLLLCFAFAALYRARRRALLALGLVLLANTNAHSAFLTAALAFVWCVDELGSGDGLRRIRRAALPVAAAASGLLFAAWTAFPGPDVTTRRGLPAAADGLRTLLSASSSSLLAEPFHAPAVLDIALFLVLAAGFAGRPSRAVAAGGATLGLYAFFLVFYRGDLRHVGLLLVLVLTLLWIEEDRPAYAPPTGPLRGGLRQFAFGAVLPAVLGVSVLAGFAKVRTDLREEMSASRALGAFLLARPDLAGAILIGEPDYALEPLPYYDVANPIYVPREGRYARWVSFTTRNRDALSLGEILDAGARLHVETGRRVLLVLQPLFVDPGPRDVFVHSYGKTFTRTADELERLRRETSPIGRFENTPQVDERYAVFELRDPPRSAAQRAPRPVRTVGIVRRRIFASRPRLQLSM